MTRGTNGRGIATGRMSVRLSVRPSIYHKRVHCASTTEYRKVRNGLFESLTFPVSKTAFIAYTQYVYHP
jgi:hypothetical protein